MAVAVKRGIYIVAAKRTPFGRYGGSLRDVHPADLVAAPMRHALQASGVAPELVDSVIVGQTRVLSGSADAILTPRHAALKVGIPVDKPAYAVNRLCGSGFQSVINGAQDIMLGSAEISMAGGTENMSASPFVLRNRRFGIGLGEAVALEDSSRTYDSYSKCYMPDTAENLAEEYKLTREEVDEYALMSQQRWKAAHESGVFKEELTPMTVQLNNKEVVLDTDEHPRPATSSAGLAELPALFRAGGVVTAGNSSGVNDGAGAVLLASEEAVTKHNLKPLARLAGWATSGVEPRIMGIGPVPAITSLLQVTGHAMDDIDMLEINEAFAAQTIACMRGLQIDASKLNLNGGAIAVGHPLAASGARIAAHVTHELRRRGLKRGIASACIGGGQGIALLLENV